MQVDNKLLDDLARVAAGAFGTVVGMREEVEAQLRQRFERVLSRMDLVSREEFEVVREMAAKARDEQEAMAARMAALEQSLSAPRRRDARSGAAAPKKARRAAPKKAPGGGAKPSD